MNKITKTNIINESTKKILDIEKYLKRKIKHYDTLYKEADHNVNNNVNNNEISIRYHFYFIKEEFENTLKKLKRKDGH